MAPITLPAPIARYFASKGGAEPEDTLACFTNDAVVSDIGEDRTLNGKDEIRSWLAGTIAAYKLTSQVKSAEERDDGYTVSVVVSGDFPGSPYAFDYRFTLRADEIARLEIDPIGPE